VTYRTVSSELLVDAPILALRRDRVTTVTGEVTREVVEHFSAAAVVAVRTGADGTREVMLVRQYRRPVDRYLWELPAGILDMVGESPAHRRPAGTGRGGRPAGGVLAPARRRRDLAGDQ
jgi:8-oxo-dGTP pyrophosphatase MutT (NUDIX family)